SDGAPPALPLGRGPLELGEQRAQVELRPAAHDVGGASLERTASTCTARQTSSNRPAATRARSRTRHACVNVAERSSPGRGPSQSSGGGSSHSPYTGIAAFCSARASPARNASRAALPPLGQIRTA